MLDDADAELDRSELRNVAGGATGTGICYLLGVGLGDLDDRGGACLIVGVAIAFCIRGGN